MSWFVQPARKASSSPIWKRGQGGLCRDCNNPLSQKFCAVTGERHATGTAGAEGGSAQPPTVDARTPPASPKATGAVQVLAPPVPLGSPELSGAATSWDDSHPAPAPLPAAAEGRSVSLFAPADDAAHGLRHTEGGSSEASAESNEVYQQLRLMFDRLDTNQSGTLHFSELLIFLEELFTDMTAQEIFGEAERIFEECDRDQDNEIGWDELIAYLSGDYDAGDGGVDLIGGKKTIQPTHPPTVREWAWVLFEPGACAKYSGKAVALSSTGMMVLLQAAIVTSILNMMIESMPEMQNADGSAGNVGTEAVEAACIFLFSIEFVVRALAAPKRKDFWTAAFTWVDLLAILPFYLKHLGVLEEDGEADGLVVLRVVRLVRLARVLRVLKLGRHSAGVQLMAIAMRRSSLALTWLVLMVCMFMALFASIVFYVEKEEATFFPGLGTHKNGLWVRNADSRFIDAGNPLMFQSIPEALWWALVTLTTVGYGDTYPVTELGKAVGGICMLIGILVVAYPITILCNNFQEAYQQWTTKRVQSSRREQLLGGLTGGRAPPLAQRKSRSLSGNPLCTSPTRDCVSQNSPIHRNSGTSLASLRSHRSLLTSFRSQRSASTAQKSTKGALRGSMLLATSRREGQPPGCASPVERSIVRSLRAPSVGSFARHSVVSAAWDPSPRGAPLSPAEDNCSPVDAASAPQLFVPSDRNRLEPELVRSIRALEQWRLECDRKLDSILARLEQAQGPRSFALGGLAASGQHSPLDANGGATPRGCAGDGPVTLSPTSEPPKVPREPPVLQEAQL